MNESKDAFIASSPERLASMEQVLAAEDLAALYSTLKLWFPLRNRKGLEYHEERFLAYEKVRVMCDFSHWGIWDNGEEPRQGSPTCLLSQELCDALACWNSWYDCINSYSYDEIPGIDAFQAREYQVFDTVGIRLAYQVKREALECEIYVFQENSDPCWLKVHQKGDDFFLAPLEPGEQVS